MTREWSEGFQAGVLWSACFLAGNPDQPTLAAEVCRAGGVSLRDLRAADLADRDAARKIISELVNIQRPPRPPEAP